MFVGLKVFLFFLEWFYFDIVMESLIIGMEKIFYDVVFGKDINDVVFGFFIVGEFVRCYMNLGLDEKIVEEVLNELDMIFDGKVLRFL